MEHVRKHASLEAVLTDELLITSADERPKAFRESYSRLYQECSWLVGVGTDSGVENWVRILKKGARIFEIGSGAGYLIRELAKRDFNCTGTELSDERRACAQEEKPNLRWVTTDGVHLTRYEVKESYDYVLSDQVVEHLHPEDIETHFSEVRVLLKPGGSYIVRTPHRSAGQSICRPYSASTGRFSSSAGVHT